MNKIDVRALKLNKWYIPKTFPAQEQDKYIAVGYFDTIQCIGLQTNPQSQHPFISGYQIMSDWKKDEKRELVDYSSQEEILYANVGKDEDGTCFAEETIANFWEDVDSPYLFLSMVHIEHNGNLDNVLKKIKQVFEKDFLSYVSFDYCDIIIFAKKLQIKEFLDNIKQLFAVSRKEGKRAIVDTFSMVSFNMDYFNEKSVKKGNLCDNYKGEKFQATINLSVRDYEGFKNWYNGGILEGCKTTPYKMYGRHDISIVNDSADNVWLMNVMKKFRSDQEKLFWTLETFIKLEPDTIPVERLDNDASVKVYERVKCQLQSRISALRDAVESFGIENISDFVLPVCEVRDCICSILKNSFAEEFVYCIYESFEHFIEYMVAELRNLKESDEGRHEEKLAVMYDKYFTALNTLVNSTMHGERQFIQATAFNAIFYTVPPKIMAFYNAYIYQIKQILADKGCARKFTYLICPSFSPVMSVKSIDSTGKPPCDRIITIKIREKTLYDVMDVSHQLVHELAHFIGTNVRCREKRKRNIMYTMMTYIVKVCGIYDQNTISILRRYVDEVGMYLKADNGEEFIYLDNVTELGGILLDDLKYGKSGGLRQICEEYYNSELEQPITERDEMLYTLGINEVSSQKIYGKFFSEQFHAQKYDHLSEIIENVDDEDIFNYQRMALLLQNIYRESYADLQMILILGVDPETYLNMFIEKYNMSIGQLFLNHEDNIRVSVVFKVMVDCGIWEVATIQDEQLRLLMDRIVCRRTEKFKQVEEKEGHKSENILELMSQLIKNYKEDVEKYNQIIRKMEKGTDALEVGALLKSGEGKIENSSEIFYFLYEYLLNVMKESLSEYQLYEKRKKIQEIRGVLRTILDFNSIEKVYNCIESMIYEYKDILFKSESYSNE